MEPEVPLLSTIRNMLKDSDLPFRDFMEVALYHPKFGYYARSDSPVGKEGDYVTSASLSPLFSFVLSLLISEFMGSITDGVCSIVDVGCGDGSLIHSLYAQASSEVRSRSVFYGVDRSLDRVTSGPGVEFTTDLTSVPRDDAQLVVANELFDASPFSRLVQRGEELHELWVTESDGQLDWSEHEAEARFADYFAERAIELRDGQFADVSLDWQPLYEELSRFVKRGLIFTFDYGFPESQLFSGRLRHFGTAAAYSGHQVSRDLLANPGRQDLTAHINFTDLQRAGERNGFATMFFGRQAKFLLAAGATAHELLAPLEAIGVASPDEALALRERREEARRLVLPDGIGEEIRVLVQGRGVAVDGWSFQKKLF